MGQRGPAKTPEEVKKARGTYREDRDGGGPEFTAAVPPAPPRGMHRTAAAEWKRLAPLLVVRGLLTEADWLAWQMGFAAYDTWLTSSETIRKEGSVLWTEKGYPLPHPEVAIAGRAYQALWRFCREFGLTPSARTGLNIKPPPQADPLEEMLNET